MGRRNRVRQGAGSGRPLREANFLPRSERKRVRRGLVRGYLSNVLSDIAVRRQERAEFYRDLRQLKMRRRQIAAEMAVLSDMVGRLHDEVWRAADVMPEDLDHRYTDEALTTVATAGIAVHNAAADFRSFSRARVWYTEAE